MQADERPAPNAAVLQASRAAFARWERWSSSTRAVTLLFLWAVAEATVWPILPDFLLVPVAIGNRSRYYLPPAAAILGMALGDSFLYLFAFWHPPEAGRLLHHLPTVRETAIDRARGFLTGHGLAAFLFQPVSGVPFKVWALLAGSKGRNPAAAIPLFILARGTRMAVLFVVASYVARRFSGFIHDYFLFLVAMYLILFLFVWWRLVS